MEIVEIFKSVEGESFNSGLLTTFVRFAGCNLKCGYCDTKWANQGNKTLVTIDGIIEEIKGSTNITLTGGEPLLQEEFKQFLIKASKALKEATFNIETNGSLAIKQFQNLAVRKEGRLRFSMDYKFRQKFSSINFRCLNSHDSLKFVIEDKRDYEEFVNVWRSTDKILSRFTPIFLSPCFGKVKPADIVLWLRGTSESLFGTQKQRFEQQVHLQLQMHKFIWNPEQRGV